MEDSHVLTWIGLRLGRVNLAADADSFGDLACAGWYKRARRVRLPGPFKDWTETYQGGVDLCS
jgi:hypothetical protein